MKLTPKREAFCLAYHEKGSPSEAYRAAYNAEKMAPQSVAVEAAKLLANPNVALRLAQLREETLARHRITVDDLIVELEEARSAAREGDKPQAAAMVAATMGKAKLLGLEAAQKIDHSGGIALLDKEDYKRARAEMIKSDDC